MISMSKWLKLVGDHQKVWGSWLNPGRAVTIQMSCFNSFAEENQQKLGNKWSFVKLLSL